MRKVSIFYLALAIAFAGVLGPAAAQDKAAHAAQHKSGKGVLRLLPPDAVTEHSIDTAHGKLAYAATAGTLAFYDQSGEQSASVFYTAYVAKNAGANRPLTFVFNGGPGAASAFLHLGLVGPRVLDLGPDGRDAATAQLRDNPDTWLAFTDLVLIDPIGTGWSRTVKPDDAKRFWSIRSDARVGRQGDRALRRQEQPRCFAEIFVRRKLWRLPRRQGGARAATRPGHRHLRHHHAVANAGRLAHFR